MKLVFRIIVISGIAIGLTACGNSLPSCSSKETQEVIRKIINEKSSVFGRFVDLKNIQENAYNKKDGIRTCTAELNTSKTIEDIDYSVYWQDKKKDYFYVEIQ